MQQILQKKTQKQAEEAKSCMRKKKKIEIKRQNVNRSQKKQENQNCHHFVNLNKIKNFQKLGGKKLESIEQFRSQGLFIFVISFKNIFLCIVW